jgi:diadenylate cyclase
MINLDTIFADFLFSLANITWTQVIDLALVTFVFYVLLSLLRRTRATVLLRGTLFVVAFFFIVTVFLPLPTFDYLIQLALIVTLIALPIIFQPELRSLLEELGRTVGSFTLQGVTGENTLTTLVRAVDNLSTNKVGGLIVLEGEDDLDHIRETGVSLGARVTSELLHTIFYDGTPLHDGAMVIRGDRVIAAGCVLPVTNRQLYAGSRRLGTRHRAAVGLTETSDALAIVVSEETGEVSIARQGRLESEIDKTALREQLHQFYRPQERPGQQDFSFGRLWERIRNWWQASTVPESGRTISNPATLLLALLLALATWMFVVQQTNPIVEQRIENIPIQVDGPDDSLYLMTELPPSVTVIAKASDRVLPSLSLSSFRAAVDLSQLEPGLHRLEVNVDTEAQPVQIVNIDPAEVDVQLVEVITRTVPVRVATLGEEIMSPALEMSGLPQAAPAEVQVTGAAPLVSRVDHVRADISVGDAAGVLQRVRPVIPVDENENRISGLTVRPEQVQVTVDIVRRADARVVGVRVRTEGELPAGYRLSDLGVSPAQVTLLGPREQLADLEAAIFTFPVNISTAVDDLRIQAALELPPGVEALNNIGEPVRSVVVTIEVEPQMANWVRQRTVEIQGELAQSFTISPAEVDVFLNGPVPILEDIDASPRLLQLVVDAADLEGLEPGESIQLTPRIIHPDELRVRVQPDTVTITAR